MTLEILTMTITLTRFESFWDAIVKKGDGGILESHVWGFKVVINLKNLLKKVKIFYFNSEAKNSS